MGAPGGKKGGRGYSKTMTGDRRLAGGQRKPTAKGARDRRAKSGSEGGRTEPAPKKKTNDSYKTAIRGK